MSSVRNKGVFVITIFFLNREIRTCHTHFKKKRPFAFALGVIYFKISYYLDNFSFD